MSILGQYWIAFALNDCNYCRIVIYGEEARRDKTLTVVNKLMEWNVSLCTEPPVLKFKSLWKSWKVWGFFLKKWFRFCIKIVGSDFDEIVIFFFFFKDCLMTVKGVVKYGKILNMNNGGHFVWAVATPRRQEIAPKITFFSTRNIFSKKCINQNRSTNTEKNNFRPEFWFLGGVLIWLCWFSFTVQCV